MTTARRTRHAAQRAGRDAFTMASAAPQVVALRLAQMAASGLNPSPRDRREMQRMSHEKVSAFNESCVAVGLQWMSLNQSLMRTWLGQAVQPSSPHELAARSGHVVAHGIAQMAAAGLAPVSRRVASNAKRLTLRGVKPNVARTRRP